MSAFKVSDLVKLEQSILKKVNIDEINTGSIVVTNLWHQQELVNTEHALQQVITGIDKGITNDILAMEIRQALHYLGENTGEITTDDLLENIFSKFCIESNHQNMPSNRYGLKYIRLRYDQQEVV